VNSVIEAQNIGKKFRRYSGDRPYTLQEAVVKGLRGMRPIEYQWALRQVNFDVKKGMMLGVIGHNGAGKSTLLRLLGHIGLPDEGSLSVRGTVGGLLEIGAGFHSDLTGTENVYVNAIISGLLRSEVDDLFEDIVAFAELEDVIDEPLRTYSTGMKMRLGFAIAAHTDPDILLIDEVLAVGDASFRQKCIERIRQFKKRGKTIVYVSHDIQQVQMICDEVIQLQNGKIVQHGEPKQVVSTYLNAVQSLS
jgi:lipopolysaccharide transport system ATP-binding protein